MCRKIRGRGQWGQASNCFRRLEILVYLPCLTQDFHPSWCETCRVIQQQLWMKECDILGGQNILWPLLRIVLRGSGPATPVIYAPVWSIIDDAGAVGTRYAEQVSAVGEYAADVPDASGGPLPPRALPQPRARRRRHPVHALTALHTCTTGKTDTGRTGTQPVWPRLARHFLWFSHQTRAFIKAIYSHTLADLGITPPGSLFLFLFLFLFLSSPFHLFHFLPFPPLPIPSFLLLLFLPLPLCPVSLP